MNQPIRVGGDPPRRGFLVFLGLYLNFCAGGGAIPQGVATGGSFAEGGANGGGGVCCGLTKSWCWVCLYLGVGAGGVGPTTF